MKFNTGKTNGDEFYTRYEDVEKVLDRYNLKNKNVYLPCDSKESSFVRYMKEHRINYRNNIDNCFEHEKDYEWADVIITNPPFSFFTKYLKHVYSKKKDFILVAPVVSVATSTFLNKLLYEREAFIDKASNYFVRPDGSIRRVAAVFITNMETKNEY